MIMNVTMETVITATEFWIVEPDRAGRSSFFQFWNQIAQIDTSTQELRKADNDDRHTGSYLLIFFICCAFTVFTPVLLLMWELSWSERFVKIKTKSGKSKSEPENTASSPIRPVSRMTNESLA